MSQPARSERLEARIAPDALATVRRAAQMQGRSLSDFVVAAAESAARTAIAEAQVVRLSTEDQIRFVEGLLGDEPPAPAMVRAHDHHRRLFGEA